MSTAAKLEIDSALITRSIYIMAVKSGELHIICNYCGMGVDQVTFFSGPDHDASLGGRFWLARAVQHMLEEHPDKA